MVSDNIDLDFENMEDDQLIKLVQTSAEVKSMQESHGWKIVDEVCRRRAEWAKRRLMTIDVMKEPHETVKLQVMAELYGHAIRNVISSFKQEGELAFEEGKRRGNVITKLFNR